MLILPPILPPFGPCQSGQSPPPATSLSTRHYVNTTERCLNANVAWISGNTEPIYFSGVVKFRSWALCVFRAVPAIRGQSRSYKNPLYRKSRNKNTV
jgi:hypothetical protein